MVCLCCFYGCLFYLPTFICLLWCLIADLFVLVFILGFGCLCMCWCLRFSCADFRLGCLFWRCVVVGWWLLTLLGLCLMLFRLEVWIAVGDFELVPLLWLFVY